MNGILPAGKHTFPGGPPPGKLDAGRFEDAPVPALRRRQYQWLEIGNPTSLAVTIINIRSTSDSGGILSKRRPFRKTRPEDKPDPPTILPVSEAADDRLIDDAREIGIIFDPKRTTSPQDIKGAAEDLVKFRMMDRVVHLSGPAPVSPYEPTKEFVDMFLDVRKQMLEKAKSADEKASATSLSVATTVKHILDEKQPDLEPAVRLARLINYHFVMSMYMSGSGVCKKYGIDGWDFLPPLARQRREAGLAREKKDSRKR